MIHSYIIITLLTHNALHLSFRTAIDYISGHCSIVTSSHSEYKCNLLHFLNIQNRENTPVKQSTRLSSDNLKKILHVHEHECDRLPNCVQYEHKGLRTEQLALNQIKDLIHCAYYTE